PRVRAHPPRLRFSCSFRGAALGAGGIAKGEDADADEVRRSSVEGVGTHEAADLRVSGADLAHELGEPGLPVVAETGEPHEPVEPQVIRRDDRTAPVHVTGFALERILPPTGVRVTSVGVGAVVAGARAGTGVVDPPLDDDLVAGL